MNLKNKLSERRQSQKTTYYDSIHMEVQNRESVETESRSVAVGGVRRGVIAKE